MVIKVFFAFVFNLPGRGNNGSFVKLWNHQVWRQVPSLKHPVWFSWMDSSLSDLCIFWVWLAYIEVWIGESKAGQVYWRKWIWSKLSPPHLRNVFEKQFNNIVLTPPLWLNFLLLQAAPQTPLWDQDQRDNDHRSSPKNIEKVLPRREHLQPSPHLCRSQLWQLENILHHRSLGRADDQKSAAEDC